MYGNIENYAEYVWKHIKDIRNMYGIYKRNIINMYGHLRKYKDYVWKHNETYGICMEISRRMQNMYGNV